jgi:hypothetical protein
MLLLVDIPVCYVDLENCCQDCEFCGFLQAVQTITYMATAIFPSLLMPFNHAFEIVSRNIPPPKKKNIPLFKLPLIVRGRLENCM